jgi:hypothetical protein
LFLWNTLKPKLLDSAAWRDIYESMRALADKHHIYADLHNPQQDKINRPQNKLRVFYGSWAALDNPWYDILKFVKRNSVKVPHTNIYVEKIYPFVPSSITKTIQNCANNDVVIMGDPNNIEGIVRIISADFRLEQSRRKTLLYNIDLPPGYVMEIPKNHMLVQMPEDGEWRYYSMSLQPLSRTNLAREMIYIYELKEDQKTYTARPHKLYEEFYGEHFTRSAQAESQP